MSISFDELQPGQRFEIETQKDDRMTFEVRKVSGARFLDVNIVEYEGRSIGLPATLVFASLPSDLDLTQAAPLIMQEAVRRIEAGLVSVMMTENGNTIFRVKSVH